ncbi:hypothetical protein PVAND_007440 [Polypedilum vanderplanki]|uniref:Aminopeptidase N n=1 Tax=Polypedilum vanderplanki TaxID=319348 RepID=A0A9J6C7B5_POLVA|nr:hypothetical protein PVAND_007440 [Polypedilum vanderplanki]
MDNNSDTKIYRINSTRTNFCNFIYTSDTPEEENIVYNRSGGCFISICRGISIFMGLLVFLFFLSFTIFFSTKYAYETKPNLTLEDFLHHRNFLIEKYAKIPKYVIPKQFHIVLHPRFQEELVTTTKDLAPFTYVGYIYVTVVSKKSNNKRIELNVKNLKISTPDVSVYRSLVWTNLDFDDDPDVNSHEILYKYIVIQRNKRDLSHTEFNSNETIVDANNGGEVLNDSAETESIDESTTEGDSIFNNESRNKTYFYPKFEKENFVPIRIVDVEMDEANDKFIIYLATDMAKDVYYVVKAKFYGNMTHDKGFYYTYYDDVNDPSEANEVNYTTHTKYFATTFLEPNNARRLYPCFDDHVFRTPFDITVSRREDMTTESSPDLEDKEIIMDDKLFIDEYNATNSMRASEIGLTITNMSPHMYSINNNLSIVFYTRNLHVQNTKFASIQIPKIIAIIEEYLSTKFLHNKIKYVTVPNSDLTLSEIKTGMIISSEMHILVDKNYTMFSENYCFEQLSLHISRLYLQDYVNYKAREHLWLHDSLGLYLQTTALQQLDKATQAEHLILEDRLNAMREELNYKSTSLQYCNQQHLDDNDYYNFIKKKGASILRMISATITEPVLRNALQKYFVKMKDQEYADFIECFNLTKIDCIHIPRGVNISDFIHRWISYEKYPIVTVQRINGSLILHQSSYSEDDDSQKLLWSIPISFTNSTAKNFSAELDYWVMDDNFTVIHNAYDKDDPDSWILLNPKGIGYYRVNYDLDNWSAIVKQLQTDHNVFPYETRAILIDDVLNLARMNMLNYTIAFNILSYLMDKDEVTLHPWLSALDNLNYLYVVMEELPNFGVVENFMKEIVNAVYNKINDLKYSRDITEDDEEKRLEFLIDDNSCMLGYPHCIDDMKKRFEKMLLNDDEVNNELLITQNQSQDELFRLLCTTIKYSGFFEWNLVHKSFNNTNDLNYRKILLRSLGCSREISLINSYINFLVQKEFYKFSQDILYSISQNKIGMKYILDYLSINWKTIIKLFDIKQLSVIFKNISNENEYKVLQEIFSMYPETFRHKDKDILKRCRDRIVRKLNWKRNIGQYI